SWKARMLNIETGSLPTLAHRYRRDFAFYVADPISSILQIVLGRKGAARSSSSSTPRSFVAPDPARDRPIDLFVTGGGCFMRIRPPLLTMQKITPFLWFDSQAEEAVDFYLSVFKGGKIHTTTRY